MTQRRSARACMQCRGRKVRCDVLTTGVPCTNCSLSSASCTVKNARASRVAGRMNKSTLPAANVHMFHLDSPLSSTDHTRSVMPDNLPTQPTPESLYSVQASAIPPNQRHVDDGGHPSLPFYIDPVLQHVDGSTAQFLSSNNALDFPSSETFKDISLTYICYVHPLLPLLDVEHLIEATQASTGGTFSPLLAQAIMFASAAYMTDAQLQKLGFPTRSEARMNLFNRVRLLFEAGVELNRLVLVQVLLLMTYWYGQQNDIKGRFYWLRIATSLAIDIGLHLSHAEPATNLRAFSRRRIWLCCVLRATLLSITERRPSEVIGLSNSLEVSDLEELFGADARDEIDDFYQSHLNISEKTLAQMWQNKLKLCLIAKDVIRTQYELRGKRRVDSEDFLVVLVPKADTESRLQALTSDQKLTEWQTEASVMGEMCFDRDHRCNGRILGVHSAAVELLYCVVLSMIHRPLVSQQAQTDSGFGFLQSYSKQKLRLAARRITEIGRHMLDGHLAQLLPPIAVGAYILASVQHLKDVLSTDAELKTTGRLFLDQTINALAALEGTYNSAGCALSFIARVRSGRFSYHSFEWANEADSDQESQPLYDGHNHQPGIQVNSERPPLSTGVTSRHTKDKSSLDINLRQPQDQRSVADTASAFGIDIPELIMLERFDLAQTNWNESNWLHSI